MAFYEETEGGIQTDSMPELDELDQAAVARTLAHFKEKMDERLHHNTHLHVHFKIHEEGKGRKKHSVHARLRSPGMAAKAEHADWRALTALQKSLDALESVIEKKLS